jgi:hypothetical protein
MRMTNTVGLLLLTLGVAQSQTRSTSLGSIEPDARLWQPWLLANSSAIRPDRPPARARGSSYCRFAVLFSITGWIAVSAKGTLTSAALD